MSEVPSRNFFDIVAGLDIGTVMPMDGDYVLADQSLGQEFKAELQQTYAKTIIRTESRPSNPSERVLARLDRAYAGQLSHGPATIREGEMIAIRGTDYVSVGTEIGSEAALEPLLLTSGLQIFGTVRYATFNKYRYAKKLHSVDQNPETGNYRVTVEVGENEGIVLYLGAAMLCETEGYGTRQQKFDVCAVPIESRNFTFFKAVAA